MPDFSGYTDSEFQELLRATQQEARDRAERSQAAREIERLAALIPESEAAAALDRAKNHRPGPRTNGTKK